MSRMRSVPAWVVGVAAVLMASSVWAQDHRAGVPRVLVDRRLQERAVRVTGMDGRVIAYVDATGLPRTEPMTEFVALLMPEEGEPTGAAIPLGVGRSSGPPALPRFRPPAPATLLELTDGQRFAGALVVDGALAEGLVWTHPSMGTMRYDLGAVLRVRLQAGEQTPAPAPGGPDLVALANGDRVEGYVESIGREVRLQAGETTRRIAVELVREVALANEPKASAARQYWLRDGSVVSPRAVRTTRTGELILTLGLDEPTENPPKDGTDELPPLQLDDLIGVAMDARALVPLARLTPVAQTGSADRWWSGPMRVVGLGTALLGLADIELPGPMAVEWVVPRGATRVAFEAELPRWCWTWGDLEVVVSSVDGAGGTGGTELARRRLHADQPRARVNVPLERGKRRVQVRVEAGVGGAVQDRVVLRRAALLVEP